MTQRWIYFFGNSQADGSNECKHLIGGKGASLADMTRAGLNVPPGFTVSTECCGYFYQHNQTWPEDLEGELRANLQRLEKLAGRSFGIGAQPLLVAVRSGAAESMPGMMDTLLNVGLNPAGTISLAERTSDWRGALETYFDFFSMFARTVGGIPGQAITDRVEAVGYRVEKFLIDIGYPTADISLAQLESAFSELAAFYAERTSRAFPTDPWEMLCASINAVFQSWQSERAVTYRKHNKINGLLGTAVTVQMMCPAEVAGVMFTANPVNQAAEIIIESAYGLGEAIVLGKVTPDRFVLDKQSLMPRETVLAHPEEASLSSEQVRVLAQLGQRVEAFFKVPCDIEWALSRGEFFLLQSRAIKFKTLAKAIDPSEREKVRQEEIAALKALAEPGGTVWSRFNLAEILPEPTPMTWSIVQQFMSGRGGFGQMYRDLGFDPDPALDAIGMFDLICGRPYCNLSREPRMQYQNMPFEHDFAWLKKNPSKALYPQASFNPRRAGLMFFIKIPLLFFKMWWSQIKQHQVIRTFADDFAGTTLPRYLAEIEKLQGDWSKLSSKDVLQRMHDCIQLTLFDFARHSLKPTALAALVLANLERSFAARLQPANVKPAEAIVIGMQKAQAALRELMMGVHPDEETDLPSAFRALREHRLSREEFLRRFGHRASQEMELAKPRWSEDSSFSPLPSGGEGPGVRGKSLEGAWQFTWLKLADEARLLPGQRPAVEAELRRLQTYMGLRETAKHHLLHGYALIRRALVELDRRYELNDGIFYLTLDDLPELVKLAEGQAPQMYFDRIEKNKRRREIALSLPLPTVLFSDDLKAVGRELTLESGSVMQGVPLSAGVVEGTAWVLEDVVGAQMPHEPYILVCPSTDPAWVPLFVQACGLVMETGGMLSHGAIVAREFGLPAVAGIADVHRRIKTGQRLRIDGATGVVNVLG